MPRSTFFLSKICKHYAVKISYIVTQMFEYSANNTVTAAVYLNTYNAFVIMCVGIRNGVGFNKTIIKRNAWKQLFRDLFLVTGLSSFTSYIFLTSKMGG